MTMVRIAEEEDVTVLGSRGLYDLFLDTDLATNHSVLRVRMFIQFSFQDGESELPATRGRPLVWTNPEKTAFANQFRNRCYNSWNDKFVIRQAGSPSITRVQFDIRVTTGISISEHWEVDVRKVDTYRAAAGTRPLPIPFLSWGSAQLYSLDNNLNPDNQQYTSSHEFGHMLGLYDEYPDSNDPQNRERSRWWLGDTASMMHTGNSVRARHYTPFADWLSRNVTTNGPFIFLRGRAVQHWVDDGAGRQWTLANAGLHV
jgi:hypothetical protein